MNLGIRGGRVKNALWGAINLPLPSSVKNVVILCGTNNIIIDTSHVIANCILSIGSIFQKKSSAIKVIVSGLILRDESWSVNRILINEVNKVLKYQCNINGFYIYINAFIVQIHGWTFTNGFLDCFLFYKDLLHLIEQGNVKLTKSWYNHINLSSANSNMSYTDNTRQKVQFTFSFLLYKRDFPPLFNFCQPILPNFMESGMYLLVMWNFLVYM